MHLGDVKDFKWKYSNVSRFKSVRYAKKRKQPGERFVFVLFTHIHFYLHLIFLVGTNDRNVLQSSRSWSRGYVQAIVSTVLSAWPPFMRALLLRLLLCSDLSLRNLSYLSGLLRQIVMEGSSFEEAWGRLRSSAHPLCLPFKDSCPSHFLPLVPSFTVSSLFHCKPLTHWTLCIRSLWLTRPTSLPPPDCVSVSSCKSWKIFPLSWGPQTSQWCVQVTVFFNSFCLIHCVLSNRRLVPSFHSEKYYHLCEISYLFLCFLEHLQVGHGGPTYLYVPLHV